MSHKSHSHNNNKKIVLNFDDDTMQELNELANELNTTPAGVISQAYSLFRLAQGRKVSFRQQRSDTTITVDSFTKTKKIID